MLLHQHATIGETGPMIAQHGMPRKRKSGNAHAYIRAHLISDFFPLLLVLLLGVCLSLLFLRLYGQFHFIALQYFSVLSALLLSLTVVVVVVVSMLSRMRCLGAATKLLLRRGSNAFLSLPTLPVAKEGH